MSVSEIGQTWMTLSWIESMPQNTGPRLRYVALAINTEEGSAASATTNQDHVNISGLFPTTTYIITVQRAQISSDNILGNFGPISGPLTIRTTASGIMRKVR